LRSDFHCGTLFHFGNRGRATSNAKSEQYAVSEQSSISGFEKQQLNRHYLPRTGQFIPIRNTWPSDAGDKREFISGVKSLV
jgi:hypothetical protein